MSHDTIPGKLVESVFKKVLAPDLTPAAIEGLAALGIELHAAPPDTYLRTTFHQAMALMGRTLYPSLAPPEQLYRLGRHLIASLQTRNVVKGAFISMARFLGPRRALKQAVDHLDRSPVKLTVTERSKTEFEIAVDDREQPEFLRGMLEEAIHLLGGRSAEVALLGPQGESNVFRASWR